MRDLRNINSFRSDSCWLKGDLMWLWRTLIPFNFSMYLVYSRKNFRKKFNPSYSESIQKYFESCSIQIGWKSIRLDSNQTVIIRDMNPNESERIRNQVFNPNQSELGLIQTEFSIRINPNESEVRMIGINSDWKFGLNQSEFGICYKCFSAYNAIYLYTNFSKFILNHLCSD